MRWLRDVVVYKGYSILEGSKGPTGWGDGCPEMVGSSG